MATFRLLCDYLENPRAIDSKKPRLSWNFSSDFFHSQSAYRVIVSSTYDRCNIDDGDLWDSTKIESDQSINIPYEGKPLNSRKQYFWKVKIWLKDNSETEWSEINNWIMGISELEEWKAKFIGAEQNIPLKKRFNTSNKRSLLSKIRKLFIKKKDESPKLGPHAAVYLRKEMIIPEISKIDKIYARISAFGYYEFYINKNKVGDQVLDPGFTDFSKRALYVTHEITKYLGESSNGNFVFSAILGGGFYFLGTPDLFGFEKAPWAAPPKIMMELEIRYKNGEKRFIGTDESWKVSKMGPIRFNCVRSGEYYDSQIDHDDFENWCSFGYDENGWNNAYIFDDFKPQIVPQLMPPIRVVREIKAKTIKKLGNSNFVVDFGENLAGWIQLKIRGNPGQHILIQYNEKLNKNGSVNMKIHSSHTKGRFQTDEYICCGKDEEIWEPKFTYHGFQFVEISGLNELNIENISAKKVNTDLKSAGSFECSSDMLNTIQKMSTRTFLNNYHSIPEDCPQREKMGWMEDGLISANAGVYNFNMIRSYIKWIRDMLDSQNDAGHIPSIVPTSGWGRPRKKNTTGDLGDPWWGGAIIMLPWKLYEHYGDKEIIKLTYPSMKKYIHFVIENSENYLISWSLGDWLEVGAGGSANRTPRTLTCSQAFFNCARIMTECAKLLNLKKDATEFQTLNEKISKSIHEKFFKKATGLYAADSQSAQAISLNLGLTATSDRKKVLNALISNIAEKWNYHLSTGIVGTYFLFEALAENNQSELAYKLITAPDYPGYGHMIANGSTTIWEDWQGKSSLNHPVQGCVSAWFYRHLGGIQPVMEKPGFKHFLIRPVFLKNIEWVKCKYQSLYGLIKSDWRKKDKEIEMQVIIPFNTTADLNLISNGNLNRELNSVKINGEIITEMPNLQRNKDGIIKLIPGMYKIEFPM